MVIRIAAQPSWKIQIVLAGWQVSAPPVYHRAPNLTSSTITAVGSATYTISCAAVPGKTLQPLDGSTASGTAVVLAHPARHLPTAIPNPWTVTSPLLPSTTGVNA